MRMLVEAGTLREQIEADPDLPCEVGYRPIRSSKRPRKYGPGEPFASLDELLDFAAATHRDGSSGMVWREYGQEGHGRAEHVFWTVNTAAFHLARYLIPHKAIRRAVITPEYKSLLHREIAETPR